MLRIKTQPHHEKLMAGLALVSLPITSQCHGSNSIGLINCFRIAKVTRSQQGHDKSKKSISCEIEKIP
jgi:hypothetical protein